MRDHKKKSIAEEILTTLFVGRPIAFIIRPRSTQGRTPIDLKWENHEKKIEEKYIKNQIYHLRRKKLIKFKETLKGIKIVLSENGQKYVLKYEYEKIKARIPKFWDKKWRLIMFDIPEKKKRARDAMREKLRELGLIRFNDSVWIYPYDCRDEVDFVAEFWHVGKYVNYAEAVSITNQHLLKKAFKLI